MGRCDQHWLVWQSLFFPEDAACWCNLSPFLSVTAAREEHESLKNGEICTNLLSHRERRGISQRWWLDLPLRAPASSDIRSVQKATTWSFCLQWADVVSSELFLFLQKMQFNPTLKLIINKGSGMVPLPPSKHPSYRYRYWKGPEFY